MVETVISFGPKELQAWRPELDLSRWLVLVSRYSGSVTAALVEFSREMMDGLTAFIGELSIVRKSKFRIFNEYSYEAPSLEAAVRSRVLELDDLSDVRRRALAIEQGLALLHGHLFGVGEGNQGLVMSPVNEQSGSPEYAHTALYLLTRGAGSQVHGWQLFIDLDQLERRRLMAWMDPANTDFYSQASDVELATHPVCFPDSRFATVEQFIREIGAFVQTTCGRDTVCGMSVGDPSVFLLEQLELKRQHLKEASSWVGPYISAISQGLLGEARRVISRLQARVLGLTQGDILKYAASGYLASFFQTFLLPCGFLSFVFDRLDLISPALSEVIGDGKVRCPVCSAREGQDVFVHCAIGECCPGCLQVRPC